MKNSVGHGRVRIGQFWACQHGTSEGHPVKGRTERTRRCGLQASLRVRGERNHDPGVVERHVQAAERLDRRGHGPGDLVLVGDVAGDRQRPAAGGGELVGQTLGGITVAVEDGDARADLGEGARTVAAPIQALPPVTNAVLPVKS